MSFTLNCISQFSLSDSLFWLNDRSDLSLRLTSNCKGPMIIRRVSRRFNLIDLSRLADLSSVNVEVSWHDLTALIYWHAFYSAPFKIHLQHHCCQHHHQIKSTMLRWVKSVAHKQVTECMHKQCYQNWKKAEKVWQQQKWEAEWDVTVKAAASSSTINCSEVIPHQSSSAAAADHAFTCIDRM